MISEIDDLMEDYWKWLRDKTTLKDLGDYCEITTPYLDRHNDKIQIYAKSVSEGILLSDDGNTIRDLEASGCELDTPQRLSILNLTLNGFGIRRDGKELLTSTSRVDFPRKKHSLIQAILAINDLFYLSRSSVTSLFVEDVEKWLQDEGVRFTPHVTFVGKSTYNHYFNFVIPKSRKEPERIVQAITRPNKDSAHAFAFSWIDTKDTRPSSSIAIALMNDETSMPSSSVIDAFRAYEIIPTLWSQRTAIRNKLAA